MRNQEEPTEGKTMYMIVILKAAQRIRVPVTKFSYSVDALTGALRELAWSWDENAPRRLSYVDPSEVVAVLREDDDECAAAELQKFQTKDTDNGS